MPFLARKSLELQQFFSSAKSGTRRQVVGIFLVEPALEIVGVVDQRRRRQRTECGDIRARGTVDEHQRRATENVYLRRIPHLVG